MIQHSVLGKTLSDEQCARLAEQVAELCLKDGDFLFKEGEVNHTLYVLVNGRFEVLRGCAAGDELTLQILKPGDMAGELGFLDGQPHSASLRAIGNATAFSLDRDNLEALLETDAKIVYEVMRAIVRSVHDILRRMNMQHVEMNNYINKQHGRY
ncbi:MAG: cyclic nucleotide-binding domain-containing protein [gamma proteobacterium symbiont of Bathyaustriella thionipta]|nr:cyclic nucleotide-binding domain-containing protein [gamma proteobacterium symbiont of Bathyaustriella thionipta]